MPPKYKKKYKKSDHVHAYLKSNRTGEDIDMLHERDLDPGALHCNELFVLNVERICIDYGRHALCEKETCKRYYERLDLEVCNEVALNETESKTDRCCKSHGGNHVSALHVEEDSAAHADQGCYLTYGDIDTAGDHNKAHSA